ncbi:MAG: hypothetical protein WBN51_08955, partial [Gammaproteobacteria bacterium]
APAVVDDPIETMPAPAAGSPAVVMPAAKEAIAPAVVDDPIETMSAPAAGTPAIVTPAATEVMVPDVVDDPTESMPAPAAGEAEPQGMLEKARAKVNSMMNTDELDTDEPAMQEAE